MRVSVEKASNENKMSDGGRERASVGVGMWKSSQKWSVQRSAVRSIAWLDCLRMAPPCDTVIRETRYDEGDTTSSCHRIRHQHAWLQKVTNNADSQKYDAQRIENESSHAGSLDVFTENQFDSALTLRQRLCARARTSCSLRRWNSIAAGAKSTTAISTNRRCILIVGGAFHGGFRRSNETELSHRWRRRAWQTWGTVS
jgi:hypothetical protein